MRVHNFLPHLLTALEQWEHPPNEKEFMAFLQPMEPLLRPMLDDFGTRFHHSLYAVIEGLSWQTYRQEALLLDAQFEEKRVLRIIDSVQRCLGINLTGDVVLFGAFTSMDGYARFEHGKHCIYLGVDESHGRGAYLDVLIAHELAHVAREPLPEIWTPFGLTPDMNHDEFVASLPVIEHLMGEGYSCVISELINPQEPPWHYCYQTEDSLQHVLEHGPAIDRVVHAHLRDAKATYSTLYDVSRYLPEAPRFAHYVWAWLWVSHLLKDVAGNNPRILLKMCAKDLVDDALAFKLPTSL